MSFLQEAIFILASADMTIQGFRDAAHCKNRLQIMMNDGSNKGKMTIKITGELGYGEPC